MSNLINLKEVSFTKIQSMMKKTYFEPGLQRRVVWEEKLNMVPYISAVIERKNSHRNYSSRSQ